MREDLDFCNFNEWKFYFWVNFMNVSTKFEGFL